MAATLLTATECTIYTSISATVGTIISKRLIEIVETRLPIILNNYFTSDEIQVQSTAVFNATNNTIILNGSEHWIDYGFVNGDPVFIYRSYRNDKYLKIDTFTDSIATVNSSYSVVKEDFNNSEGPVILFALVNWPEDVKAVAAEMVYYDADIRSTTGTGKVGPGIRSRSLGPLSESFAVDTANFGYPYELLSKLDMYKLVRLS